MSLSLPPAGWWPLAYLAPVPFLWLTRGSGPGRSALAGFVFGLTYFGALLYWILLFGEMGFVALVLLSATFTAAFGALAPALWREAHPIRSLAGLGAAWTVLEWVRGAFPLGGFGWGQLGTTQVDAPSLPLASVTGVWGLSFLVLVVAGLVLLALQEWGRGAVRSLGRLSAAAALVLVPALIPLPAPDGPELEVAAIQVDVESVEDLVGLDEDVAVARLNVQQHRTLDGGARPDLVVWGEGSLDPGAAADPATRASVRDAIASVGSPTLAGAVVNDPDGTQRTAVLAFDGSGEPVDRYDKVHLVPFGEYVPWRGLIDGFIDAIDQVPVDRTPGVRVENLRVPGLPPIGAPICYENSFPSIDRAMVRQGAGLLVVTINNASYDRTAASAQHLQMSRLRAVENGRWVVHAAVSGISAFIDPHGDVIGRLELFEPGVLRAVVRSSGRTTPYTRFGDWVPWGSLVLALGCIAIPRGRRGTLLRRPGPLPADPRVLVIVPTYDERATIERVLDGLLALPHRAHVLVVDDGSPDGTADVVADRARTDPRVRLLRRERKTGLARAYAAGFDRGLAEGYDLIVEMDADLSHRPDELPRLLEAARSRDVVVGSRYVPGGSVENWSAPRRWLSRAGNAYTRFCLGIGTHDATSGFRVYRRDALAAITAEPVRSDGYGFQVELVYRARRSGLSVGEAPITFHERAHGRSKISRRIVLEALWLVTRWGIEARFRPAPTRADGAEPSS